jgi:drug/metabolite transporter (DMT)-like permease
MFAGLIGWVIEGSDFLDKVINSQWVVETVLLGSCFVGMFYLMAVTTHKSGTSSTVVANKMSVIIPVVAAFYIYNDDVTLLKILGIVLAMIGIFLVTRTKNIGNRWGKSFWLLILIFIGSGLIDTFIKLIEQAYLNEDDVIAFTTVLFLTAFIMGLIILSFRWKNTVQTFRLKKLLLGLLLGSVNFASIYFLVLALKESGIQSSALFPINNIGIVLGSTILSILLFKEQLSTLKIAGIAVSILSLLVLMMAA